MTRQQEIIHRLRLFLLGLAGFIFAGVPVELYFAEHTEQPLQFVPFVLSGLGVVAVLVALLRAGRGATRVLRAVAAVIALGGLLGMYFHLTGNLAFAREIQPNATATAVLADALRGAAPLLAPGILTIAAMLAVAGTYAEANDNYE
ncbi:MAG: hypothetical protein KIS95_09340 [Anaerolineae bacterium]|uniref:hypothetical protein n=1 Tax=Promineifilum sp. TaxID=2664178 RepID=UPI001D7A0248|nr:hypothetical protein [Anaerolineales bacterium]MCB8935800.1 hypothetical protein [Promineifilum sp.]MCO5180423.1 hypothetical protein [Promineifilum sp.]MCW5847421.1 hypothetical protein [Anaerolineae bacterium]